MFPYKISHSDIIKKRLYQFLLIKAFFILCSVFYV